jgi:hypothetical protein
LTADFAWNLACRKGNTEPLSTAFVGTSTVRALRSTGRSNDSDDSLCVSRAIGDKERDSRHSVATPLPRWAAFGAMVGAQLPAGGYL